jgi:hypothetical protein
VVFLTVASQKAEKINIIVYCHHIATLDCTNDEEPTPKVGVR